MLFLTVWLGGWVMGEVSAIREIAKSDGIEWFKMFWLGGWTLGGGWALLMLLWMAAGREIVTLRSGEFTVRREILGVGFSREFDLAYVRNLRIKAEPEQPGRSELRMGGTVAFDYGAKTYTFGISLDEPEASEIISELRQRHSFAGDPA